MVADSFTIALNQVTVLHRQFGWVIDAGFLVFARLLGFILVAPVVGRKDIPFNIKLGIALFLTFTLMPHLPMTPEGRTQISSEEPILYSIQIMLNVVIGYFIGFIAECIMQAINSAGSMVNNQIGLSSAMMFDPSSRQQVALVEKLFSFIGLMVFLNIGGFFWLISALHRTFEVFPVYSLQPDIVGQISLDYVVQITSYSLLIGTVLMSPVLIVTMAVDLILGIVNRTAQQIQVFQLSHALKPVIGLSVFWATLSVFVKLIENYLTDHASIF